jgi:hypothetical protein
LVALAANNAHELAHYRISRRLFRETQVATLGHLTNDVDAGRA